MTDDCRFGTQTVHQLLSRFGLGDRWCFVDYENSHHGMSRPAIEEVFASADLFIDMGTHGSWLDEASKSGGTVLVDGEPAFTQLKMQQKAASGQLAGAYDAYFTTGWNIGTNDSTAPTGGRRWQHLFHPVSTRHLPFVAPPAEGRYTTVMNWQSYEPVEFGDVRYGHKDVEFRKFRDLPGRTTAHLEAAVSGSVPRDELQSAGWHLQNAHEVTRTYDSFMDYIHQSRGEFGVCKNGYVVSNSGWFSDRSAAYLASGRPVILQETGFSQHLPTGRGLFAVSDGDEAAAALEQIEANYVQHTRWARNIAEDYLDTRVVLGAFLEELGIAAHRTPKRAGVNQ